MPLSSMLVLGGITVAIVAFLAIASRGRKLRRAETEANVQKAYVECRNMIADFGELMERSPLGPTEIADASRLPHPKDTLVAAFRLVVGMTKDEAIVAHLRVAALELAQYQDGVGPSILKSINLPSPENVRNMLPEALARAVLDGADPERWKAFNTKVDADIDRIAMAVGISRQLQRNELRSATARRTKR